MPCALQNSCSAMSATYSTWRRTARSGRPAAMTCALTRRLSKDPGCPESFGRMQITFHSLAVSKQLNSMVIVAFTWDVRGCATPGSRNDVNDELTLAASLSLEGSRRG